MSADNATAYADAPARSSSVRCPWSLAMTIMALPLTDYRERRQWPNNGPQMMTSAPYKTVYLPVAARLLIRRSSSRKA